MPFLSTQRKNSRSDFEGKPDHGGMMGIHKLKATIHKIHDGRTKATHKLRGDKEGGRSLCHECERIPFNDYLPRASDLPRSRTGFLSNKPTIFCINLEHVLFHRSWCKFCGFLFKSICRPEYDLLKAEHIGKYLHDSEKLKDIKTFEQ